MNNACDEIGNPRKLVDSYNCYCAPLVLALGFYGATLARIFSNSIWFLWLGAIFLALLYLYGLLMLFGMFVSLIANRFRALLLFGPALAFAGFLGVSPITRFVLEKRDERFMSNLPRYQEAVARIEQHRTAQPVNNQFPDLAPDIQVRIDPSGGFCVFFKTYPGPFGTRLRGYAYTSTDQWNETFVKNWSPVKLTNNWYRL